MSKITVDLRRIIGEISPLVFGHFVEHMHRCVYGGIFDESSPLSDARGFRRDVLQAARAMRPAILRWPGGNFVSGYHWEDGIGPIADRPRRMELAWGGVESNRFGTDEAMEYCSALGAEPYICVNLGTGTLDEARNWVEYCNASSDTYYARLRRENGHPEPYNVKHWGLGNEMYGEWQQGHKSATEYAALAREAAKVMRGVDPSVKLVACGHDGISDWDRIIVEQLAPLVDYVAIHIYTGSEDYFANVLLPHHADRCIRHLAALIEGARFRQRVTQPIHIAYDEWNVWTHSRAHDSNGYEQPYNLADALAVATYLNIFLRNPRALGMANLAQMVNVLGAIITSPDGMLLQTIYHPIRAYANGCGPLALDCFLQAGADEQHVMDEKDLPDKRLAGLGPFDMLDAAATWDPDTRRLTLSVVNRDPERDLDGKIELLGGRATGNASFTVISGPSTDAGNTWADPDCVRPIESDVEWRSDHLVHRFPPHSITLLRIPCG